MNGQTLPVVCGGSKVRYGVSGLPDSNFDWVIEGGTINVNYNDSIDVTWNNIQGIHQLSVTEYTVTNCTGAPVTELVMVSVPPSPNLGDSMKICKGQTVSIGTTVKYNHPSYLWNTNATSSSITASNQEWYYLQVTDSAGCTVHDSIYLAVNALPVIPLAKDTTLCGKITSIALNAETPGGLYYLWSNNQNSPTIDVDVANTYWVKVTNENGCEKSDTIVVKQCTVANNIFVPNAFTPGDNNNSTWVIQDLEKYPNASVDVYDRWGRIVYQAKEGYPSTGWDGSCRGRNLPMDSYFYIIKINDGSTTSLKGSVTIIR
jgi:gliding motility-associated-like protein